MNKNKEALKQTLLNNLCKYGLNPTQWKIHKAHENIYHIQNKKNPDWCFVGTTSQGSKIQQWDRISLMSL